MAPVSREWLAVSPGVIVDRYADVLVCQFLSAGAERLRDVIVDQLVALTAATCVYERSDADVREKEGLVSRAGLLRGREPGEKVEIREGECRFLVDVRTGHKTGFYLDQRENRFELRAHAAGKHVLNCFSYTGAFAVHALAAASDLRRPWGQADRTDANGVVIGELAGQLGSRAPGRLVASAKSWLCHAAVDRTAPILPWGADPEVPRVSPLAASASYLTHVAAAWDHAFPAAPLAGQEVVLTVPASFDEAARTLTRQAAELAGLPGVRLLEEPQAAFYDWAHRQRGSLAAALEGVRLALVCDVGGGTTDLSRRWAVLEHM